MKEIHFTNFHIQSGEIRFRFGEYVDGELREKGELYFLLTPQIRPREELIALSISTLCGNKYQKIHLDLSVDTSILGMISDFTAANVVVKKTLINPIGWKEKGNVTLNFSGGFDSLAAKCLMPKNIDLVSMDFGGKFSRERKFFERFNTCIVETNIVETHLRANSWSFMGIANILFSEYLGTNYYSFGNILAGSNDRLSLAPSAARNVSFPPFLALGMKSAPYVAGLTEVGTLRVLGHFDSGLVSDSLNSLANPGEDKRYRKQNLATIVEKKFGYNFDLDLVEPPKKAYYEFGKNYVHDFLAFYGIKNNGLELTEHTVRDIPKSLVDLTGDLSLDFFEKVNPNFFLNFPSPLLPGLIKNLANADILPYTEQDWLEFARVRDFLSQYR